MQGLLWDKMIQWSGVSSAQNNRRLAPWVPVKRIRRAEEIDLRGPKRTGQMHRRRIDRHKQSRPSDKRTEGEQV